MYDPKQRFIQRWKGRETVTGIDGRDVADWPREYPGNSQ